MAAINHMDPSGFESTRTATTPSTIKDTGLTICATTLLKNKLNGTMVNLIPLNDPSDRATRLRCANTLSIRYRSLEILYDQIYDLTIFNRYFGPG